MLNIIQNTIGAIRRVGESVVRAGLKMWLPFTKAEPLGENLVVNGDFATDSDWDKLNGATISDNKANITGDGTIFTSIKQDNVFVEGKVYICVFDVTITSGLGLKFQDGSTNENIGFATTSGVYTFHFTAGSDSDLVIGRRTSGTAFESYVNSVSIEEYAQETPDISGNDNNAILKTGKCLTFTGNDSVDTSFPSSKTIKTIAFWIYPTHTSSAEAIFYGGGGTGGTRELRLAGSDSELESINGNIVMNTYVDGVYSGVTHGGTPAQLELDQWQRVVLTSSTGFSVANNTFNIGAGLYAADGRFKMSDLQIYGAEFTTDDIAYDYANPQKLVTDNASSNLTLNDLHAWWHMSEGDGTIAFDSAPLIGKELVTNRDFSTDGTLTSSSWALGWASIDNDGTNISDGVLNLINDDDGAFDGRAYATNGSDAYLLLDSNKTYAVTYTISENTDNASLNFYFGSYTGAQPNTIGTHTVFHTQSGGALNFVARNASNNTTIKISNISVKEVYNIDGETYDGSSLGATYDDAQERIPQLGMMNWSKGSNLFEYSEDLSQNYWIKNDVTVTLNDGVAPDGTMSASKLSFAASSYPQIYNNTLSGLVVGEVYTASFYAKSDGTTQIQQETRITGITPVNPFTATSEWQRVEFSFTATLSSHTFVIYTSSSTAPSSSFYVWGLQMEKNSSATAYRRTNGTAVTDATLISCATDSQKDILGNAVRVKGSGFNLDGTGYAEVLYDNVFDIPACNFNDEGGFSLMGWIKFDYVLEPSGVNTVYYHGVSNTSSNSFSILTQSTNKITSWVANSFMTSTTTHNKGDWVHFALTRDNNGNVKLYINKTVEATLNKGNSISNSDNKVIGWGNGVGDRFYHERIDDIKFYNIGLSSDEIEQNYNATKSGHNN